MTACDECLRRAWLLGQMAGHLEHARRRVATVLALDGPGLIDALGGERRSDLYRYYDEFDVAHARARLQQIGMSSRCRHGAFPPRIRHLDDPPHALFIVGNADAFDVLATAPAVAIVGARRVSAEGPAVARALGRGIATAGVCVVSGLALGIDSAAHEGALSAPSLAPRRAGAATIAVLGGGADVVYPASGARLYAEIATVGCVVSEMPPGTTPRKWMFPARNRLIAALGEMTVVVQAQKRSGSLITADLASQLGRPVGAVPGSVASAQADGTNALLADGAHVIRDAADVLDLLCPEYPQMGALSLPLEPDLEPDLADVLEAVTLGMTGVSAICTSTGNPSAVVTTALVRLELLGLVTRQHAGGYERALPGSAPTL